jgi:hypothetical protein
MWVTFRGGQSRCGIADFAPQCTVSEDFVPFKREFPRARSRSVMEQYSAYYLSESITYKGPRNLSTEHLILQLRLLDIQVTVEGDRLRCSAPPGRLTKELERTLLERKAELISALSFEGRSPRIARRSVVGKPLPLSFAQERFWFEQNLNPDSTAYNITASCRLQTQIDSAILEKALQAIVQRHEILRTRFVEVDGVPAQEVLPKSRFLTVWNRISTRECDAP